MDSRDHSIGATLAIYATPLCLNWGHILDAAHLKLASRPSSSVRGFASCIFLPSLPTRPCGKLLANLWFLSVIFLSLPRCVLRFTKCGNPRLQAARSESEIDRDVHWQHLARANWKANIWCEGSLINYGGRFALSACSVSSCSISTDRSDLGTQMHVKWKCVMGWIPPVPPVCINTFLLCFCWTAWDCRSIHPSSDDRLYLFYYLWRSHFMNSTSKFKCCHYINVRVWCKHNAVVMSW